MSEFSRVLFSKRIIIITALSVFLASVFFLFDITEEKNITLKGEELLEYVNGYPEFLENINENVYNSAILSSLGGKTDYIKNNARKTVSDYEKLKGLKLGISDNTVVAAFSNFVIGDIAVILVAAAVFLCFSKEREKGLSGIVRCTKHGRARLFISRSFIIFSSAFFTGILVTFFCMFTGWVFRGRIDFFVPLQQVPEFRYCSYKINIFQYLFLNAFLKAVGISVLGFISQIFLIKLQGAASILAAGAAGAVEITLYALIGGTDRMGLFKIVNVIPFIRGDFFFKYYYNVDFFNRAAGFLPFSFIVICLFGGALIIFGAYASEKNNGEDLEISFISKIKEKISSVKPNPPVFLWETKKLLINQKGVLIIGICIYVSVISVITYGYFMSETPARDMYYEKYAGEINREKIDAMIEDEQGICDKYDEKRREYWELRNNNPDSDRQLVLLQEMSDLAERLLALHSIIEEAQGAYEITCSKGITTYLIKPDTYELLLENDRKTTDKICIFILLCLIGVLSGIYSNEWQCKMMPVLKSLKKGRESLFIKKAGVAATISGFVTIAAFLTQFMLIGKKYGYNDINASVQSIEILRNFPFGISFGKYLVLVYCIRVLSAVLLGFVIMLISCLCKSRISALAVCFALLALPAVLSVAGLLPVRAVLDLLGYCLW